MSKPAILQQLLENVYEKHLSNSSGEVAQYIPELARVDPAPFGIAIATVNKDLYTTGDVDVPFTIQSISKPFVFGMALEHLGHEKVYRHVGTEPSGEAFNSIELDPVTKKPHNPMVNSGAIAMSSLIYDQFKDRASEELIKLFSGLSDATLDIDENVFNSELQTAHRNRALIHLMRGVDLVSDPVEEKLKLYTRQCSINITARQLAISAATLANFGVNPFSGKTVFSSLTVRHILSVMFTCGMYDYAGRWAVDVGLPAKSGVSGGVMAVVNRQIGIGIFSPRLDEIGNSVRASGACIDLAGELGLHAFEFTNKGSSMLEIYL
jgi:glutaminase